MDMTKAPTKTTDDAPAVAPDAPADAPDYVREQDRVRDTDVMTPEVHPGPRAETVQEQGIGPRDPYPVGDPKAAPGAPQNTPPADETPPVPNETNK
jgi:hypothetical protein